MYGEPFAADDFIRSFVLLTIPLKLVEDYSRPKLNYTNAHKVILSFYWCCVAVAVPESVSVNYATLSTSTGSKINC